MSTPADIFLSYNREDQATARQFAEAFDREGFKVWWDATLRSGEAYDEVTEKALREAKAVVVLWSKKSVVSRWVRAEATLADRNKTLVPAMIEPCERPIMFELTQTAELAHWQGAADDKRWLTFLADVRRFADKDCPPAGEAPAAAATRSPSTPPAALREHGNAPSLAVLPFTNRSGLPEDEVFSIGMVEDVIDALSQSVNVRVIASSATARFRAGAIPDLESMARQLGVRYILEGNVRRVGTNLRVTAQLVETASGAILWTQKFDRPLTELAALQEELVLQVAAHLDVQVQRIEMERALKKPVDLTAWEAAMLALYHGKRLVAEANISKAIEEARRATVIAPDYGLAHAVLAHLSGVRYLIASPDDPNEVRRIRDQVDRALELDPDNPAVLTYVAHALSFVGFPQDALRNAERAVRLSGAADAHHACGIAYTLLDRSDEALARFEADMKASPGGITNHLNLAWQAAAHVRAGRWTAAMATLDDALALNPDYPFVLLEKALLCSRTGRSTDARNLLARVRRLEPRVTLPLWELGLGRWYARNPVLEELRLHLRTVWGETEPGA